MPVDEGAAIGGILARSGSSDVVDAHLVAVGVTHGLDILTGDVDDIGRIVSAVTSTATVSSWP